MPFNSIAFLTGFPIFCALFFAVPARQQRPLLILASIAACSYAGYVSFLWVAVITVLGYGFGRAVAGSASSLRLAAAVLAIAAPLVVLKYTDFFMESVQSGLAWFSVSIRVPRLDAVMPIGLSFYTFVVIGYLVDVHLEEVESELRFERFSLLTLFFPKFVSGPVERAERFLPQLEEPKRFDYARVTDGIRIMGWGFFKKLVVADRLGAIVDGVYENPQGYTGLLLALVNILYMFQVYYDFCGYSDIAVGAARVLGYDLTWNFNRPYAARSVSDYWRRWHISLTSWFFEYIFFPITAALRHWKSVGVVVALTATFLVSGLWHGARWTFVLFGLAHSAALSFEHLTAKMRKRLRRWAPVRLYAVVAWTATFTFLAFADVLFRARSIGESWAIWNNMVRGIFPDIAFLAQRHFSPAAIKALLAGLPILKIELVIGVGAIAIVEIASLAGAQRPLRERLVGQPAVVRWAVYYAVAGAVVFLGAYNNTSAFLYVRF